MVRRILAVTVLAMLTAPGLAHAATTVNAGTVSGVLVVDVDDDDSSGDIDVQWVRPNALEPPVVAVTSAGGATTGTPGSCEEVSATQVGCQGDFEAVRVFGNGGNDTVDLFLVLSAPDPALSAVVYGDAGNDTLNAHPDNRVGTQQPEGYFEGGSGNDKIIGTNGTDELHGGDGNDILEGWEGADAVYGEGGDDSVSGGVEEAGETLQADRVDGGPGFDSIPAAGGDYNRGIDDDVSVTMDGAGNDGEAGEGDNVTAVEKLRIAADSANYSGTGGPDDVFVDAANSTIRGLGGDDKLVAYDGNDTIEGGDGNDFLEGGFGNDVLDGGAGVDAFRGDRIESNVIAVGADQIRARDGNAEQIDCGIGPDTAQVDASDVVVGCESVDRGPVVVVVDGMLPPPGKPKVLSKLRVKRIASKGLVIQIACPAACTVAAELRVDKATARKLRLGRSRVLARGSKTLRAAGNAKVTLKVVSKARKRFKRLRKAKVRLVTRTTIAGTTTRATRTLKLKR